MTDLQDLVDKALELGKLQRQSEYYTLKDFIKDLETCNPEGLIEIKPFSLYPMDFTSYRGYYEDLCLTYTTEYNKSLLEGGMKVKKLLEMAKACINKEFTGYKGGVFEMTEDSVIWLSQDDRCSGLVLTGIKDCFGDGTYYELQYKQVED